jgi:hypothetical protein
MAVIQTHRRFQMLNVANGAVQISGSGLAYLTEHHHQLPPSSSSSLSTSFPFAATTPTAGSRNAAAYPPTTCISVAIQRFNAVCLANTFELADASGVESLRPNASV